MNKKEHFEVILEDINFKLDLVVENFQSLRDKIDENKIDSDKRNDETNKLLKFAKDDSDKRNDETNKLINIVYHDLDKKIQENGLKIEENSRLIEENGKKMEIHGKQDLNCEKRLVQLE